MKLGVVLPLGQSRSLLEKTGQWDLWKKELVEYQSRFGGVEFFEYRYCDWRRFVEGLVMPMVYWKRFRRCGVLKAVHLTGAVPCLVAKILWGKPYVLSYGYRYDEFARFDRKWLQWVLVKLAAPVTVRLASAVMVPTEELKRYVIGLGAKRVEVIPNGVDSEAFRPRRQKAEGRRKKEKLKVLFVGRLERQKNLEALVRAVARTKERVKLVIIGDGSEKNRLKNLVDRLGVEVEMVGVVANDKLSSWYRRADVFVLPSLVEGHPKALLEAMSCGLACVAADVSGCRDIITDGRNGLLVEPVAEDIADGLGKLVSDNKLRRKFGLEARKTILERFDKKRLFKKEIELFKKGGEK